MIPETRKFRALSGTIRQNFLLLTQENRQIEGVHDPDHRAERPNERRSRGDRCRSVEIPFEVGVRIPFRPSQDSRDYIHDFAVRQGNESSQSPGIQT
jgi:hypothetical protein